MQMKILLEKKTHVHISKNTTTFTFIFKAQYCDFTVFDCKHSSGQKEHSTGGHCQLA